LPSSGLLRSFTTSVINDDFYFVGTSAGELLVFSISNKNLKAIIPVFIFLSR